MQPPELNQIDSIIRLKLKTHVIVELHPPVLLLWVRNDPAPEEDFLNIIRKLHFQLSRFMMHAM